MQFLERIVNQLRKKKVVCSILCMICFMGMLALPGMNREAVYTEMDFDKVKELLASLPDNRDEAALRDDLMLEDAASDCANYHLWDAFYGYVKKGIPASMIKAFSTDEGDMLYIYISYDGEKFYYVVDQSRAGLREDEPEYYEKTFAHIVVEERTINRRVFQEAILTNDENLTCEEYDYFWVSSLSGPMPDAASLIFRALD